MRAQLMREIKQPGSPRKRIVGYQLNIDGTVDAHEIIVTGNDAENRPGRRLEAPEIDELNDQLRTLK